jgi:hypothetical protein
VFHFTKASGVPNEAYECLGSKPEEKSTVGRLNDCNAITLAGGSAASSDPLAMLR